MPAGKLAYLLHGLFHYAGNSVIVFISRLAVLEINIRVLSGTLLMGMLRIKRAGPELGHGIIIHQLSHIFIIYHFYLLYFVRGAEAVKEMKEGNLGLKRGKMRHKRQIHYLLNRSAGQHGKASLTTCHNVRMVAENGKRVSRERTSAYMEYAGKQFARDFIHIGNHKQQTLAGGKGAGKRACGKRAVNSARSASFRLHLSYPHSLSEQVFPSESGPFIAYLRHGRGGSNGIDSGNIAKSIGHMACSRIAVNGHGFCHCGMTSLKI